MNTYEQVQNILRFKPKNWLITGVAGFIGSNLLEALLKLNQKVVGIDNFSTGYSHNLDQVQSVVGSASWKNFRFFNGDISDLQNCHQVAEGVDFVLHQAAIGSVPRSLEDPITTNNSNITGFLNMLVASRDAKVKRFVYAASSSTYGDHPGLPKVEDEIGKPLSPYAVTKYVNEIYAEVFGRCYNFNSIGLRYFNVFGPRQDPNGAYAAVIPLWYKAMINNEKIYINGDGETSRDFCFVDNVVMANILAATTEREEAINQVYNIGLGDRTSLNQLFIFIRENVAKYQPHAINFQPIFRSFRPGDVRHSQASIEKIKNLLGYYPKFRVSDGLKLANEFYFKKFNNGASQ